MTDLDKTILFLFRRQRMKNLAKELAGLGPHIDDPDPRPPEKPIKRRKI